MRIRYHSATRRVWASPVWVSLALLALAGSAAGCGARSSAANGPDSPQSSVITRAEATINSKNILSATITVETAAPTRLTVMASGQDRAPWAIPTSSQLTTTHEVPVFGLYAESSYEFAVTAITADGTKSAPQKLTVTTSALPTGIPAIKASVLNADRMSPGITLLGIARMQFSKPGEMPSMDESWSLIVGVDQRGKIAWFQENDSVMLPTTQLANGLVLGMRDRAVMALDMKGEVVWQLTSEDVGVDSMHHEVMELPSGNLLSLSSDMRKIDGYTDKSGKQVTYNVVGDVIVEFTPSGELVKSINLFDLLDPYRVLEPDFHFPFWDKHYSVKGSKDWTHANGITYDPKDDSYILSLRHQNWIIKVDRATEALVWKLGPEGEFTLSGPGEMPYHQHRAKIQADGTLTVYDNGNGRPQADKNAPPFTRAVAFRLDEAKRQFTQVWEYRGQEPYFAPIGGDFRRLANGNALITNSAVLKDPAGQMMSPFNPMHSRIEEVTYEAQPEKLFELTIHKESPNPLKMYLINSALRIPNLYIDNK